MRWNGTSPLKIVALRGHLKVLEKLLEHPHIILNSKTRVYRGQTTNTLLIACQQGHVDIVRLMIETFDKWGLTVDDIGGSFASRTPLQVAVFHGNTKVVKLLLLRQDIDVNRPSGYSKMSLCQVAVQRGHAVTLGLLLEDCRTDRKNAKNSRDSLLIEAFSNAQGFLVEILLDYDEVFPQTVQRDVHVRMKFAENHIDLLKKVLVNTAVREYLAKDKRANLWLLAARTNNLEFAMVLLEHAQRHEGFDHPGLDVNWRDGSGDTPLHVAVYYANAGSLEVLLNHRDIDINITSRRWSGESAIQMAIRHGKGFGNRHKEDYPYIVDLLLAHGAQSTSHDQKDDTNDLVPPPLLDHAEDSNNLVLPFLLGYEEHQVYHSAGQNGDLRQKIHPSWASVVGIQDSGVGSGETNRDDENMVGDMIPMEMEDWTEEDPNAVFEEFMHFDEEEVYEYNGLGMLDQGTFCESLGEATSFPEERNM